MERNVSLKDCNTFGFDVRASKLLRLRCEEDLDAAREAYAKEGTVILGGGSNIIFDGDVQKTVLKTESRGMETVDEDNDSVTVEVSAGEVWKDFVMRSCQKGLSGAENLAAIPGCVGAAPVQNIGAYGAEAKDIITEVLVFDMENGSKKWIKNEDCRFSYRYSVFKYQKGNLLIWKVRMKLKKHFTPNLSYRALAEALQQRKDLSPTDVAMEVTKIRDSKLPDPKVLGNVGSFFKNPVISREQFTVLKEKYPNIVSFDDKDGVKVSAGWMIDCMGLKGVREGNVGMHAKQALVMVNYGGATAKEILAYAEKVISMAQKTFGITLQAEPHIVR